MRSVRQGAAPVAVLWRLVRWGWQLAGLRQQLRERNPVVHAPAVSKTCALTGGEPAVIKDELAGISRPRQREVYDGVLTGVPTAGTPRLHQALILHHLQVSAGDVPPEEGEGTADLSADGGRLRIRCCEPVCRITQARQRVELRGTRERLVDSLTAGAENDFLMDRLG